MDWLGWPVPIWPLYAVPLLSCCCERVPLTFKTRRSIYDKFDDAAIAVLGSCVVVVLVVLPDTRTTRMTIQRWDYKQPVSLIVGIKELSRSSCRDPEVVAHPNPWDRNRMGGGYRSPRSWMISISTGTTTTLVVTLILSRSIILKSNSSTFTSLLLLCTEDSIWANLVIQHTS